MRAILSPFIHSSVMTILSNSRIDVWQFSLATHDPAVAQNTLSTDEIARANQFYFPHHKQRFTRARSMLRHILGLYLNKAPETLVFTYNARGKPALNPAAFNLEFNLSHSADIALLAVGQSHALGIDIECFSARPFLGISRDLFSAEEQLALQALPKVLHPLGFFNVWSQKEALMKAMGLGLAYPTQHLNFPLIPNKAFTFTDSLSQIDWVMQPFMPETLCSAALCYHPSIQEINFYNDLKHA